MLSTNSGTASPASGASSTRKPKLNIPEVKKPNVEEHKAKIETGQQALDALFKQLNQLSEKIGQLTSGNADFSQKRDELRLSLDKVQAEVDELESERNRLIAAMEASTRTGRDMKTKVQGLKKSLGFQSSDEIDAKIREIERHMLSQRWSVTDENKMISQIRQLEKSKPLVMKYADMESDANSHSQTTLLPLRIRLDEIKEALKDKQQRKRQFSENFSALMAARTKSNAPIRELSDEKDVIKKQILEKRAEVNQAKDELYQKQREYEAYMAKFNRANEEIRAVERKKLALNRQKQDLADQLEEIEEEAWSPELSLTHQTVGYLRKLVEKTKPPSNEVLPTLNESAVPETDGKMVMMKPKNQREEEYYFAPTKRKAGKKQKKVVVSLDQPLVHDLSTLTDFQKLKIEAPLTLQECPALLETLEEKLTVLKNNHSKSSETMKCRRAEVTAKLLALEATIAKTFEPAEIEAN